VTLLPDVPGREVEDAKGQVGTARSAVHESRKEPEMQRTPQRDVPTNCGASPRMLPSPLRA
jgi:hypothetical protein